MPVSEIGDPRLEALFGAQNPRDAGVRPTVRLPRKGVPSFVLVLLAGILGVAIFVALNLRRIEHSKPQSAGPRISEVNGWAPPPPLYIPPAPQPLVEAPPASPIVQLLPAPAPPPARQAPAVPVVSVMPVPQSLRVPEPLRPSIAPERVSSGSALVIDSGNAKGGSVATVAPGLSASGSLQSVTRMRASALANRSMTVPQGYLIPAVLETGFDSTKPGFARAIVSRDVRGFDGKNVLIPRGSRLIGEYQTVATQGQNRAVITWTRLLRPDGMTITLDSPAVDTLGRGGVAASVNTHFFARLGDALLQSTVELGRAFAGRAITGPVVVLPGATTAAAIPTTSSSNYAPTLKVPPGRSISVFVAHDLDFSAAGTSG